ncbi:hypothetical protein [Nitrospira sp. BLG_1]|uniref:hypothetical protein n=1 Tax=Nitrospira sp. BLG_1 TaxID=3395883 RepID=UPI0039BD689B
MRHSSATRSDTIIRKLRRLPAKKQAAVLDFVDRLASGRRQPALASIYSYSKRLVTRKGLRKFSLRRIASIVHEVRNIKD